MTFMRIAVNMLLAALVLALVGGLMWGAAGSVAQDAGKVQRTKWEYRVLAQATPDEAGLTALGEEGWELIAVTGGQAYIESSRLMPQGGPGATFTQNTIRNAMTYYHFKRQK